MFHEQAPEVMSTQPMDPVQKERGRSSNSSIAAQTTVRGQPVILPPGKTACKASSPVESSSNTPET